MCGKAMRLHPHTPIYYFVMTIEAYYRAGRYEECLAMAEQVIDPSRKVEYWPGVVGGYLYSAMAHIKLGQESEARKEVAEALKIWPWYSLEFERSFHLGKPAIVQQELYVLRKAGVPEHAPLPLPDKPSIAVLPFVNMSEDPKQEYFSDGITEEIITALSKTPKLFVIARNSTFTYKGKPTKVQQVGRELGVKYVLEGSVRKSEDTVRITAQLVDAQTGHHLWAERYDRDLRDVFAIQDEITMKIIAALQVKLTEGEQAHVFARGTKNLQAYLKSLEAREYTWRVSKDGVILARKALKEAIELDPGYGSLYAQMGWNHLMDVS